MANSKYQIGDIVSCLAKKVFPDRGFQAQHDVDWRTLILTGRVLGKGQDRKTKVEWTFEGQQVVQEIGAGALNLVSGGGGGNAQVQAPPPPDSTASESSGESGSDMDISGDEEGAGENEAPPQPDDAPPGEPLKPGGLVWWPERDGIEICARESSQHSGKYPAAINWTRRNDGMDVERTPLDYFLHLCPNMWKNIVKWTNHRIGSRAKHVTKSELIKFFGVTFTMTLYPKPGKRHGYWSTNDSRLFPAFDFGGKFGMSKHRYDIIMQYLSFHDPDLDTVENPDPWRAVRVFIIAFNENRKKNVKPSWVLVVDESTSKWRGLGDWYTDGMPHITKIPRKPEPVGLELKDMCCGESGIMMFLEIMEGKAVMARKEFTDKTSSAGTAHVLRAAASWKSTGRVICGDSAFASVETCICVKKQGLHFVGLVKNCSALYPKRYLQTVPMENRGDVLTFTAQSEGVQLLAQVWNDPGKPGKPRKCMVSTFGTSLAADPVQRPRKKQLQDGTWEDYYKSVPRTELIKTYFDHAGAIDRHNRVRMAGVRLERVVKTKSWWRRVMWSVMGIIITDAFYAMKLEGTDYELHDFMEELCEQMIWNNLPGNELPPDPVELRPRQPEQDDVDAGAALSEAIGSVDSDNPSAPDNPLTCKHNIYPLTDLPIYQGKRKATLTCKICKAQRANYYCHDCSNLPDVGVIAVCGPQTKNQCMSIHCSR